MERVAFLVDDGGARIDCLLNPETLEVRRLAGVRTRGVADGRLTGAGFADDPIHFTGGGRTDLTLDLLFDVDLVESPSGPRDVRALTRPLWQLAENSATENRSVRPPLARFVWGKSWNVPGVVSAVAERFDRFSSSGVPLRSWLRLRFIRVAESATEADEQFEAVLAQEQLARAEAALATRPAEPSSTVIVPGDGAGAAPSATRFDLLSTDALGNPFLWRLLAAYNDVDNPLSVAPGTVLAVPPPSPPPVPPRQGQPQ